MSRNAGLTLIELLFALALLSILFFMCLPSGLSLFRMNQLQVMENEITTAVRYARNMALLYDISLVLSPLPNSNDWSQGMILFEDNTNHKYQNDVRILHQWQWQHHGLQVAWNGFHSSRYLLFSSDLKHAATSGHFNIINFDSKYSKLVVNRFGRISKQSTDGFDNLIKL